MLGKELLYGAGNPKMIVLPESQRIPSKFRRGEIYMLPLNALKSMVEELHIYGENIIHLTDELSKTISEFISAQSPKETSKELQPEAKASTAKSVSLSEVRHRLSMLAQAGFSTEATSLIIRHGAKKLSDLNPAIYGQILQEVDKILKSKNTGNFKEES